MQTFKRKWQGVFFNESGTTMPRGSMGMSLAHSFHNLMKRVCAKIGAKVLVQKTGHYEVYGFIQRADGQIIYYSWGDFRGLHIDVNASGPVNGVYYALRLVLRTITAVQTISVRLAIWKIVFLKSDKFPYFRCGGCN